ncbi:MAG: helix-turn-helix transcriptional regulator [Clostridia bacterium]|nr:helix-turn-helix transcriptional regulator [Clostridia bacterium]
MDLVKIGAYIAGKRKALGLTQRQLAEKLGMSDKSVSKWERGVCLPDVSVYFELCQALGISINEFLAGEDIVEENIIQKSEENIIQVTKDSKHKQKHLKSIIGLISVVAFIAVSVIAGFLLNFIRPKNNIEPYDRSSIEMKTAEMLSGSDGVYMYKFNTTDRFEAIKLYIAQYRQGVCVGKEELELSYDGFESPKQGTFILLPEFEKFNIRFIVADDGSKAAMDIPILEDVADREYLMRSATQIGKKTKVRYNEEQALVAFVYDNDAMRVGDIQDYEKGISPVENDCVYCFSVRFCKD